VVGRWVKNNGFGKRISAPRKFSGLRDRSGIP
jgi:hypothetical protein